MEALKQRLLNKIVEARRMPRTKIMANFWRDGGQAVRAALSEMVEEGVLEETLERKARSGPPAKIYSPAPTGITTAKGKVREDELWVIGSDFHYGWQDPRAMTVWFKIAEASGRGKLNKKVDGWVMNGDICHLPKMSRWPKDKDWRLDSYSETRKMLRRDLLLMKELDPTAQRIARPGNHDDNFNEYFEQRAGDGMELQDEKGPLISFARWIGFEDCGWAWWEKAERAITFPRHFDPGKATFLVVHGDVKGTGKYPSNFFLSKWGRSGCSSHTHKPQMLTTSHWMNQPLGWWVTGCMCRRDFQYLQGEAFEPNWVQGFLSVRFNNYTGQFWPQHHFLIESGGHLETIFDGQLFTSRGGKWGT